MIKDFPKKVKHSRVFRVKLNNYEKAISHVCNKFHRYGLKALENGKLKKRHFNAISRLLKRLFKKRIYVKYNISLITPVTKKPTESRMGKGKAPRDHWECPIRKGMILIEFGGHVTYSELVLALVIVQMKLPMLTKVVNIVW